MDWQRLNNLRKIFLAPPSAGGIEDYWSDPEILKLYDQTLAQRILWKWLAVWKDLDARGWRGWDKISSIGDWGCGTGIAIRSLIQRLDHESELDVVLLDRSPSATRYAAQMVQAKLPRAKIKSAGANMPAVDLLLISHVSNELTSGDRANLLRAAKLAKMVVWVEPGTSEASQSLIEFREMLRKQFVIVAPCARQDACPLYKVTSKDWCHQFAEPPPEVFHDPFWSEFARRLKIDLRSVPLSYLALERNDSAPEVSSVATTVGSPRKLKHMTEILICTNNGSLRRVNYSELKQLPQSGWSVLAHDQK